MFLNCIFNLIISQKKKEFKTSFGSKVYFVNDMFLFTKNTKTNK